MARVRRFDEELSLLDDSMSLIARVTRGRSVMASEEIFSEFVAGIPVAENARIIKPAPELLHDRVRVVLHVEELRFDQRYCGLKHRTVCERIGLRIRFVFEMKLGFENQTFRIRQV